MDWRDSIALAISGIRVEARRLRQAVRPEVRRDFARDEPDAELLCFGWLFREILFVEVAFFAAVVLLCLEAALIV
jgi:hypothetical protein